MPPELADMLRDIANKLGGSATRRTMAEAVDAYSRARLVPGLLKPRSLEKYTLHCRVIRERWGELAVADADWTREAAGFLVERGNTAHAILVTLRTILIMAQRLGWRQHAHGLDQVLRRCGYRPREACFTEAQLAALGRALDEIDRLDAEKPFRAHGALRRFEHLGRPPSTDVLRVLMYTGCRLMEIASLRVDEIGEGTIRLRDSKVGPRTIPICREAQEMLTRQQSRDGWVFPGWRSHVTGRTVLDAFHRARQIAGLREGTVHTLRHSWATIAARHGVPLPVLQAVLGHSTAWITARYLHASQNDGVVACAVVANAISRAK